MEARYCDGCGKAPHVHEDGSLIPLKRCTRCRHVSYHDAECQRRHYKEHKAKCRCSLPNDIVAAVDNKRQDRVDSDAKLFQVEERKNRGKCLVAKCGIRPGQAVIAADKKSYFRPMAPPVLFQACRRSHCAVCFGAVTYKSAIWLCENPKYSVMICSEDCREKSSDWLPQEICAFASVLESYYPNNSHVQILPTAILVYRLVSTVAWKDIMDMQSHDLVASVDEETVRAHQQAVVMLVIQMIAKTDGLAQRTFRVDESEGIASQADKVTEVLNRIKCNAFTVTNGEPLGIAVYGTPSYRINHSCDPNSVQRFLFVEADAPRLRIDVWRPIEPGQEVCISYIDNLEAPAQVRRETLAKQYCFHCCCPRCEAE
jgi:SET domain/MYND finger